MLTPSLVVSEVYGPTFQGEGPHTGQRVAFVRLGGCNLHCSWCDTAYTWDASRYDLRRELGREQVETIASKVAGTDSDRVIISGGEPLLHQDQDGWADLLARFAANELPVDIETNGTIAPSSTTSDGVDLFMVSPKLEHAGDPEHARIKPDVLATYAGLADADKAALKFVVTDAADVQTAARLADRAGFPRRHVWVMPEGVTASTLLARHPEIADAALDARLNFTSRLHVLTWGEERMR